jgi:hypothetical protein
MNYTALLIMLLLLLFVIGAACAQDPVGWFEKAAATWFGIICLIAVFLSVFGGLFMLLS